MRLDSSRFILAWFIPLAIIVAMLSSPWVAAITALSILLVLAFIECAVPAWSQSPRAAPMTSRHRWLLRVHVLWQGSLLGLGVWAALQTDSVWGPLLLGFAVGVSTAGQGITFAHELGHGRTRGDRFLGWLLMGSVCYVHFMVEHYRGHHARASTPDDPATARRGESLWRFLPRTVSGSWRHAWQLEARRLAVSGKGWRHSPLAWAVGLQVAWLVGLGWGVGGAAVTFWLAQAAYAVFLLETINYIEHYGLRRQMGANGRPEPFGVQHAWGADHLVTNSVLANLQRHSDHHMHAWKSFTELEDLPAPRLPTGYAGCVWLACCPWLWRRLMEPRLRAMELENQTA